VKKFLLAEIFCFFASAKGKRFRCDPKLICNERKSNGSYLMGTKKYKLQGKVKPRVRKAVFMLSDEEHNLIQFYLKKYKITNRSRWYRETVLNHILKNMEQDYPTLFEENEMRR